MLKSLNPRIFNNVMVINYILVSLIKKLKGKKGKRNFLIDLYSYQLVHQISTPPRPKKKKKSKCRLKIRQESNRKSSNKEHRQPNAFSSEFSVSAISLKPLISKKPTLLIKMIKKYSSLQRVKVKIYSHTHTQNK